MHYPVTETDPQLDILHGVEVPDPYRYLEEPTDVRTADFVAAQNALSEAYLADLPDRDTIRELVYAMLAAPRQGTVSRRGGRYFRLVNPGGRDQDVLICADSLDELLAGGRVIFDPLAGQQDTAVAIGAAVASPNGAMVAVAVPEAGSDWNVISVIDTETGNAAGDRLLWSKFSAPCWLPDSSGFCYWRFDAPADAQATDALGAGYLVLHRLGTDQDDDQVLWHRPAQPDWMVDAQSSSDGQYLMLTSSPGTDARTCVAVRRWNGCDYDEPVEIITELTDEHVCVDVRDGELILLTHAQAERGRLVAISLADPAAPPRVLVAEDDADVLETASTVRGGMLLVWSRDASHLVQFRPDHGTPIWLELPDTSSITALNAVGTDDIAYLGLSSFTTRLRVFAFSATTGALTELPAGTAPGQPEVLTRRIRVVSTDGAEVPMTMVRRADLADGPRPCLLYGYGGFNIAINPEFNSMLAGWVAMGGVLAVANLRGGSEFGESWHTAGMMAHKQQVFDDLYACAQGLTDQGWASAIAVHGRSNGGLLAGAALVQRPELWAAALPTVGVLDMLRFHLFTIGRAWVSEYGNPDDPAEFATLHAYSPLHNLVEGTVYPPTLISTGDHDDRVVPAHSLKFAARLQACQVGPGPVLLRVDTRAGHGMGKPLGALADEYADQIAFAARHTGLTGS